MLRKSLVFLGPCLFVYLIIKIDFITVIKQFHSIRWMLALGGIFLVGGHIFLKAFRWNCLLHAQKIFLSYQESCWIYLAGLFLGVVTPGRVGDFSKVWYLTNKGYRFARAMVSVVLDRLLDVAFFIIILGTGQLFHSEHPLLWLLIWSLLSGGGLWLGRWGLIKRDFYFAIPEKWKESLCIMIQEVGKISLGHWVSILFITWCGWIIYFSSIILLSYSIGIALPFGKASFAIVLSAIINFLPVSFLGIGTRDGLLIFYFQGLGLPPEQALGFSLCILLVMILTGIYGLLGYGIYPLPLNKKVT